MSTLHADVEQRGQMQPQKGPKPRAGVRRLLLRCALVIMGIGIVWLPEFRHYRIDRSGPAPNVVAALRTVPADSILREVGSTSLHLGGEELSAWGSRHSRTMLQGYIVLPLFSDVPIRLHGHPDDFLGGPPSFQLFMASLGSEGWLLDEFGRTGDRRFLDLALRRVLQFADYERGRWMDRGFLWNDHAIAARIAVLVKLWQQLRSHEDLFREHAVTVLALVVRSARWLANPAHFTVRTNHGVMQNLALLQVAAAFPLLSEVPAWRQLALQRLQLQLGFYVSREGFVLEHSAGYQRVGVELLTHTVRMFALNGLPVPPEVQRAAVSSRLILGKLLRPDGSLPLIGNTVAGTRSPVPYVEPDGSAPVIELTPPTPVPDRACYPLSGYALWWSGVAGSDLSQTAIAWAKHEGHGHKHADEGAVLFWSGGIDWITATGYWPYGLEHLALAYSWSGSNAPHALGEAFGSRRETTLRWHACSRATAIVDLERTVPGGGQLRRQLIQLDPDHLVVVDFAVGVDTGSQVIWTVDPRLGLERLDAETVFRTSPGPDGRRLTIALASLPQATLSLRRGSIEPFAGWTVVSGRPVAASALQVRQGARDSVSATLFALTKSGNVAGTRATRLGLARGATPESWSISVALGERGEREISRIGSEVAVTRRSGSGAMTDTLALEPGPNILPERAELRSAYLSAVAAYPPWRDLSGYRERVSWAMLALAIVLESLGWLMTRILQRPRLGWSVAVHWTTCMAWVLLPLALHHFYLRVQ